MRRQCCKQETSLYCVELLGRFSHLITHFLSRQQHRRKEVIKILHIESYMYVNYKQSTLACRHPANADVRYLGQTLDPRRELYIDV